tara:strand:+ start:294 stop:653 length:360 start_codon:yes stop_codon:yes gene_type:complete
MRNMDDPEAYADKLFGLLRQTTLTSKELDLVADLIEQWFDESSGKFYDVLRAIHNISDGNNKYNQEKTIQKVFNVLLKFACPFPSDGQVIEAGQRIRNVILRDVDFVPWISGNVDDYKF